jgi:hypothetical protein
MLCSISPAACGYTPLSLRAELGISENPIES